MKLIDDFKRCKSNRQEYRIKPSIEFRPDTEDYYFSFFPTILFLPWIYRHPYTVGVIDIWWLHFHILIGSWEHLSCKECKHQKQCVESNRLEWYYDDVFEQGENCSEFESKYYV